MLRKFVAESDLKIYTPFERLEGPLFAYGKVGSGKSVCLMSLAQGFKDIHKYTIWHLFGGNRNESEYWSIPSDEESTWAKVSNMGNLDQRGPKQYDILFLYPYFESKLPKKIPKSEHVQSQMFTIPLKDVTAEDIEMVTGPLAENSKYVWKELAINATKKDSLATMRSFALDMEAERSTIYKSFILPMSRENFLMDKYCDLNIDLKNEARNKERVKILVLRFVPKEYRLFVLNYIMKRLVGLLDESAIPKKNILIVNEASVFFRATENSVLPDNLKLFRTHFAEYIKEGRRGMYFFLDCQSSYETRGIVQGQEDYLVMFRLGSWRDKADLCEELRKERRMRPDQIGDLARLDKGEAYIAESGKNVKKIKFMLPRTMFWKKERGDFYKAVWERCGGQWHMTEQERDYVNERFKKEEEKEIARVEEVIPILSAPQPIPITPPKKIKSSKEIFQLARNLSIKSIK